MGDRYYITVTCPRDGTEERDVYFAPTCDLVTWTCPTCRYVVDLIEYTGITKEEASNDLSPEALGVKL